MSIFIRKVLSEGFPESGKTWNSDNGNGARLYSEENGSEKVNFGDVTEERDAFEGIYTVYQLLYIPPPKLTA